MTNASKNLRSCPTRADGVEVLIAHSISSEICQERQRRLYHKCFTCAHRGAGANAKPPTLPAKAVIHELPKPKAKPKATGRKSAAGA